MQINRHRKLASNVIKFLDETAESYGRMCEARFSDNIGNELLETGINSPIEDIFYIALNYKCHDMDYLINPYPDYNKSTNSAIYPDGIYTYPQRKIGKYIVDFLISYQSGEKLNEIIVELDGHGFHDRDKKQRAYEKARDRYLVQQGYKVFHYTGSEIVANPFGIAHEVIREITKRTDKDFAAGGFVI